MNCRHPKDARDVAISNPTDPNWAYCYGCRCVLHKVNGRWQAQETGVTRITYEAS